MTARNQIVLDCVLRLVRPLVRLLVVNGVHYPAFAAALKRSFLDAAQAELARQNMAASDSALSLLSGVHRRDVRNLTRGTDDATPETPQFSFAGEVAARWMSDPRFMANRTPLPLARSGDAASFETLVAAITSDVRPRAVADEMLRLGVVREADDGRLHFDPNGFAPRQGFEELSWLLAANAGDHLAAGVANLQGEANFLEQSISCDELTGASAAQLQDVARRAWHTAFKSVMPQVQRRFDADKTKARPDERRHRMRVGMYYFSEREKGE